MTSAEHLTRTVQVHRVYIKAPIEKVWAAIVDPAFNCQYGYAAPQSFELRPGGAYTVTPTDEMRASAAQMGWPMPDTIIDGEVIEVEEHRLLKQTWRMLMDPTAAAEGFSTLTYTLKQEPNGVVKLTLEHDVTSMPTLAAMVAGPPADQVDGEGGGGWPWVLSDLKSLLETGSPFSVAAG